jgi:hypothetical protein
MLRALDTVRAAAEPEHDVYEQTMDLLCKLVRRFHFEEEDNVDWNLRKVTSRPTGSGMTVEFDHYFGSDSRQAYVYGLDFDVEHKKITVSSGVTNQRLTSDHVTTSPHLPDRTHPMPRTGAETVRWFLNLVVHDLHGFNVHMNGKPVHLRAEAAAEPTPTLVLTRKEIESWAFAHNPSRVVNTNVEFWIGNRSSSGGPGQVMLELRQYDTGHEMGSANYAYLHLTWSRSRAVTVLEVVGVRSKTTEYRKTYRLQHQTVQQVLNAIVAEYFRSREGKIFLADDVDTTERHRLQKLVDKHKAQASTEPKDKTWPITELYATLCHRLFNKPRPFRLNGYDGTLSSFAGLLQLHLPKAPVRFLVVCKYVNPDRKNIDFDHPDGLLVNRTGDYYGKQTPDVRKARDLPDLLRQIFAAAAKQLNQRPVSGLTEFQRLKARAAGMRKLVSQRHLRRLQNAPDQDDEVEAAAEPETSDSKSLFKFLHGPFFTTTVGTTTLHFNRHTFGQRIVELGNRNMYRLEEFWNPGTTSHDPAGLVVSFYGHGRDERHLDQNGEPENMESEFIRTWHNQQDLIQHVIRIILMKERKRDHTRT